MTPQSDEKQQKKKYKRPELIVYGTVSTLTKGTVNPKTGMDNPGNLKTG